MTKVFKEPTSYTDRVLRRSITRMASSNWIEEEGPQPGPATLTPFKVGQRITGVDFGNVNNGDTSSSIDSFLAGLTYDENNMCFLFTFSPDGSVIAMHEPDLNLYGIFLGERVLLYANKSVSEQGISAGFNNLTNGKYNMSEAFSQPYFTVSNLYGVEGWNGTLIGAVTK